MSILVVAEHDNKTVKKATLNAVAAAQPEPATRTAISPPIFAAAATVLSVEGLSDALSCSAITRTLTI